MNIQANKNLGQHFCVDKKILEEIVFFADNINNKNILEVGPGTGNLSNIILKQNPKHLIAIEKDIRFKKILEKISKIYTNFEVLFADALNFKFEEILKDKQDKLTVISNLPYNISNPIMLHFLKNIHLFDELILVFQKEVAQRIVAKHGNKNYGRISILVNIMCHSEYLMEIPPHCFNPQPKVTSAAIKLIPKKNQPDAEIIKIIDKITHIAFQQRRKQIKNSLIPLTNDIMEILKKLDIDPKNRSESLTIENFYSIAEFIKKNPELLSCLTKN